MSDPDHVDTCPAHYSRLTMGGKGPCTCGSDAARISGTATDLEKYGAHEPECHTWDGSKPPLCTCGLVEAVQRAKEAYAPNMWERAKGAECLLAAAEMERDSLRARLQESETRAAWAEEQHAHVTEHLNKALEEAQRLQARAEKAEKEAARLLVRLGVHCSTAISEYGDLLSRAEQAERERDEARDDANEYRRTMAVLSELAEEGHKHVEQTLLQERDAWKEDAEEQREALRCQWRERVAAEEALRVAKDHLQEIATGGKGHTDESPEAYWFYAATYLKELARAGLAALSTKGDDTKPIRCSHCGESFPTFTALKTHVASTKGDAP